MLPSRPPYDNGISEMVVMGIANWLGRRKPEDVTPTEEPGWVQRIDRKDPSGNAVPYTIFCLGPLGNWHPSPFVLDGHAFHCLEQYLMWRKALLFGDEAKAREILEAPHAARCKELGRQVRGFDPLRWYCEAKPILHRGALHGKFAQHVPSRDALLATTGTILVEASNSDFMWGIGLAEFDRRAWDMAEWRGTNWLGEVLTVVRVTLETGSPAP